MKEKLKTLHESIYELSVTLDEHVETWRAKEIRPEMYRIVADLKALEDEINKPSKGWFRRLLGI